MAHTTSLAEVTSPHVSNALDEVASGLHEALRGASADVQRILATLDSHELEALGREAGESLATSLIWSEAVGERLDTSTVAAMLGITRQALSNRKAAGSLIALDGTRTSWWPTWQFERSQGSVGVRPVVLQIVSAFREYLDERATSFIIASWASTPQPELDGATPADWIAAGKDEARVVEAATQAAWAEAR